MPEPSTGKVILQGTSQSLVDIRKFTKKMRAESSSRRLGLDISRFDPDKKQRSKSQVSSTLRMIPVGRQFNRAYVFSHEEDTKLQKSKLSGQDIVNNVLRENIAKSK